MGEAWGGKPLGKQPVSDASPALASSCLAEALLAAESAPWWRSPTQLGCGFTLRHKNARKANGAI